VDPEHWRRPVIMALGSASQDVRIQLLESLSADPSNETALLLREVAGRDAESLRARLIRENAPKLFVKSFGGLRVRTGGWDGPETTVSRPRQRALLAYLVARIDNPPARDQVIEALWPNSDLEDAVNSLNQSVYQLRRAIDPQYRDGNAPQYVISTADTVRLDTAIVRTDLAEFREGARELERSPAVSARVIAGQLIQLVDGEFLSDLVYEDWADRYRLAVHAEIRQVLFGLTQGPWLAGYGDLGLRAAVKLAELDPWDEQAHLAIARCLQAIGRREAARQVVRRFLARLRNDLGQGPEADFSAFDAPRDDLTDGLIVK
jgi:DNA-binding transcriptional activator of the SARP family